MPPAHWRWQFPSNPFSRPIVYLAETPDGRLVGHYALIPRPFRDGSRRTLAALSIQSMVHPDFQKQGILKALAAAAEKQLDEDGVDIGITFLNDNSLHAYTQHFGWTELAGSNFILFTVLECGPAIQKILKVEPVARFVHVDDVAAKVERVGAFVDDIDIGLRRKRVAHGPQRG